MATVSNRVNVLLDDEHAVKLRRLAERTHTNPGTLARSLLASAIEDADPDARTIADLLDRIDGAVARAEAGRMQLRSGLGIALEDI